MASASFRTRWASFASSRCCSRSDSRSLCETCVGVRDQPAGEAGEPALARAVGVVGLLQRVDEPAQVVVGVVGDVGRELRVAEIGDAAAMRGRPQRADEMRLARARLAVEQQDAVLRAGVVPQRDVGQKIDELGPRLGVHLATSTGSARQMSSSHVIECSKAENSLSGAGLVGASCCCINRRPSTSLNPRPARSARRCSCRESPSPRDL